MFWLKFKHKLRAALHRGARGQGLVEYALLISFVAIASIAALSTMGGALSDVFEEINCSLGATEGCDCETSEAITKGPSYACIGGMFSFSTLTSCGDKTSLSMVVTVGGSEMVKPLSYNESAKVFETTFADTAGLCDSIEAGSLAGGYLLSNHKESEIVNKLPFKFKKGGTGGGSGGGSDDDPPVTPEPTTEPTAEPTAEPTEEPTEEPGGGGTVYTFRMNAGYAVQTTMGGKTWEPGAGFSASKGVQTFDIEVVEPATDNSVYTKATYAKNSRDLNWQKTGIPTDTYTVKLYFIEDDASAPSKFHIEVQGVRKVENYRPLDAGLKVGSVVTIENVVVSGDGVLAIKLDQVANWVGIAGIEIIKGGLGPGNRNPVIGGLPDQSVDEGASLTVNITATDPDDDPVTISLLPDPLPDFMTFNAATGQLAVNPPIGKVGVYELTVEARDNQGGLASKTFSIEVISTNHAPVLNAIAAQEVVEEETKAVIIHATDEDNDTLALTITEPATLPAFMSFTAAGGDGVLSLNPQLGDKGTYSITVQVSDGRGGTATQTFDVVVKGIQRVTSGLLVLYEFDDISGGIVRDTSGTSPLDLTIADPSKVTQLTGGISVNGAYIASSGAALKIIDPIISSREFTVEMWVKPANTTQSGPARMFTISSGTERYKRNVMLGQETTSYMTRVRVNGQTKDSAVNEKSISGAAVALQHVVLTYTTSGQATLYINNVAVSTWSFTADFSKWDRSFKLILANEATNNRAWAGEIYLAAAYNRALSAAEVAKNYKAGANPTP
jgi:Flp pilus assembly pilin Flp